MLPPPLMKEKQDQILIAHFGLSGTCLSYCNYILIGIMVLAFFIPNTSFAEALTLDIGSDSTSKLSGSFSSRIIQMIGLVTVLSIAPAILMMVTSFTRIVIVFSILRNAIGLQQSPPSMVLASLSLFLTFFIMAPTFEKAYNNGLQPLLNQQISEEVAWEYLQKPFHQFMIAHTRDKELALFTQMANITDKDLSSIPMHVLIPAFMISEIKRAFEIGFLIFLPFIIIDLLVSSVLMAMGMMMLPPVMMSLPFKLIFFVLIDGWYLLCGSLVKSYG